MCYDYDSLRTDHNRDEKPVGTPDAPVVSAWDQALSAGVVTAEPTHTQDFYGYSDEFDFNGMLGTVTTH
jgi:hypothetical protein